MVIRLSLCATLVLSGTLVAAAAGPKDEIAAAAKKLAQQPNYSWKTTFVVPEGTQFRPGPREGKSEKDGCTFVKMSFGDNTMQFVIKGDKAAILNREGSWQLASELANAEGPGRFLAMFARSITTPAAQAAHLASSAKELKKEGDVYSGDLSEEGAKSELTFGRGGDGPEVSSPKGTVKFWLKDGKLVKYEYHLQGKMAFGGNDVDIDRTATVEIKDVGKTKLEIPKEAQEMLD